MNDTTNLDFQLIMIMSAGHSGSTLLNLLLNGHNNIQGMSEISNLNRFFTFYHPLEKSRFDSTYWKSVVRQFKKKTNIDIKSYDFSADNMKKGLTPDKRWLEVHRALYESIYKVGNKKNIVDASKWPKRIYWMLQQRWPIKVLYLTRDTRGVIFSYYKKWPINGMRAGLWISILNVVWKVLMVVKFPYFKIIHVKHEDLVENTSSELRRICEFLELPYQKKMLNFATNKQHGVMGNRMRFQRTNGIQLVEEWKTELSMLKKIKINILAFGVNLINGYVI